MALKLASTEVFVCAATEADLVSLGNPGQQRRVILTVYNTDTASRTVTIHEYAAGGSPAQTTAVHAWLQQVPSKNDINIDTYLLGDRKITALADVADVVLIKVSVLELTR